MARVVDKRWTRKLLGLHVTAVGFPRLRNITTISGPHPVFWWKKVKYYERDRRANS
jgi:hypothetical protein